MAGAVSNSPAAIRRRRRRRVPDENRKRAPRACDRCKARKSRCIETDLGICQRCHRNSLSCRFGRERSPPELAIRAAVRGTNGDGDGPSSISQTSPDGNYSLDGRNSIPAHAAGEPSTLTTIDPTERFMWPRFLSRLRETFSLDSSPAREEHVMEAIQAQAVRPPALQPAEFQRLQRAVDAFPPRPVADFLISVCIDHGFDSFFYFNQAQFLAEVDQFYANKASRLRSDCSFVCLAHAVFALGSQWTTLAKPEGSKSSLLPDNGDPGRIFYDQARSLIPDVIDLPCLRAIQAPFVMGVYLLPASAIGSSYVYLGLALRKALALDLHLHTDESTLSEEESEIRRRIWWAIYSLERSSTVKLNRPRSINTSIVTVPLPRRFPSLDNAQKFDNIQHQIANAQLMMILDKVAEPSEWSNDRGLPNRFEIELKEWKRSLPSALKFQNIHPQSSCYRASFHLHINYYFTWIAMGKVSVVTLVRAKLRYHFKHDGQPQVGQHVESLARSCVKAAKKMLQLFEDLRRTGNLTRFSFTDFQGCSIATIVVLLAGILERDSNYDREVSLGLDCLRAMAEGNIAGKMGVGFVETLQAIANEAAEKLLQTKTQPEPNGTTSEQQSTQGTDYNGWVTWLANQNQSIEPRQEDSTQQPLPLAGGAPLLQRPHTETWPTPRPSLAGFSSWDGAAALQQLSVPSFASDAAGQEPSTTSLASQNADFLSTLYGDDQTFLLGLTGLDVLGFSELNEL